MIPCIFESVNFYKRVPDCGCRLLPMSAIKYSLLTPYNFKVNKYFPFYIESKDKTDYYRIRLSIIFQRDNLVVIGSYFHQMNTNKEPQN